MATFYKAVSERTKANWEKVFQDAMGRKWEEPTGDERGITCETKIEDTTEIDKIMRQKPGYSVDVQGREG